MNLSQKLIKFISICFFNIQTKFDRAAEDLGINDMDAPMLRNMVNF